MVSPANPCPVWVPDRAAEYPVDGLKWHRLEPSMKETRTMKEALPEGVGKRGGCRQLFSAPDSCFPLRATACLGADASAISLKPVCNTAVTQTRFARNALLRQNLRMTRLRQVRPAAEGGFSTGIFPGMSTDGPQPLLRTEVLSLDHRLLQADLNHQRQI